MPKEQLTCSARSTNWGRQQYYVALIRGHSLPIIPTFVVLLAIAIWKTQHDKANFYPVFM